ncbi:restriction endonuclease [Thermomonas aquatica]|uniref:Restriction endonuclease n=1 Tax=Thermomonas aquatica TaxID=2202149 RepID=A0A5B7ZMP1_9GAMM|nr:restriction endonuclease [Thermomonas aquatica]QDA55889.1 restriction endonuclease [Thermomonas aquatica]
MTPLLLALFVFAIAGGAATYWLRQHGNHADASVGVRERGEAQLAELRWRDFTRLVLQAMKGRGYEPVIEDGMSPDGIPSDGGDILLERNGEYVLLSCKYGSAAVVGVQAILGLGKSATLRGAGSVILATPGRFESEAMRVARQQGNIELLDGKDLWPELRPYVAREPIDAPAPIATPTPPPKRAVAIAWGGAAALAAVAGMIAQGMQGDAPASEAQAIVASAPAPATPADAPVPKPAPTVAANDAVPTDPAALERRRRETANAISTLFGVDRALWSTQSTLLVYLSAEEADPSGELCPLLERYPELAASRVQLQPPQGSQRPVRFKQCRSY